MGFEPDSISNETRSNKTDLPKFVLSVSHVNSTMVAAVDVTRHLRVERLFLHRLPAKRDFAKIPQSHPLHDHLDCV